MAKPSRRLERNLIGVGVAFYLILQVNAALHEGSKGQDFQLHTNFIKFAAIQPLQFLAHYSAFRTNPPLFHYLASLVYRLTGGTNYLEVIALISACVSAAGILVLYWSVRELFESMAIRLACLFFILFLPFAMIQSVVLAADALATPVFLFVVGVLIRMATGRAQTQRGFLFHMAALCTGLVVGVMVKFTFGSLIVAALVCLVALERTGLLTRRRAFWAAALVILVPGGTALFEAVTYVHDLGYAAGLEPNAREMNFRSLVFFRPHDVDILDAPGYFSPAPEPNAARPGDLAQNYDLLLSNKHSYPALLHLGMYSDLLNIYQQNHGVRSRSNQHKMALAVRLGIPFSVCMLAFVPVMAFRSFYITFIGRKADMLIVTMISLAAGLWFLNIALPMPFAQHAYSYGYWTPRLVAPALLCFAVIAFVGIDRLLRCRPKAWVLSVLLAVICQAALHASFLWPWGIVAGERRSAPLMETASFPSGAIVVEAEMFSTGNVVAGEDAGIQVVTTPIYPAYAEYRVRIPAPGGYALFARFASAETRALTVSINGDPVSFPVAADPTSGYAPQDQRWQEAGFLNLAAGLQTIRLGSTGPFPCLDKIVLVPVWYTTPHLDALAEATADAVNTPSNELIDQPRFQRGTLILDAEKFSRGNAVADFASYGRGIGVVVTPGSGAAFVEYDLTIRSGGDYDVYIRYAAETPRPITVAMNGRQITAYASSLATGGWDPSRQRWQRVGLCRLVAGANQLRLSRAGVFPAIDKIALQPCPRR